MLRAFRTLAVMTLGCVGSLLAAEPAAPPAVANALESWNDGLARQAVWSFVERVTREGSAEFVSLPERIAVFDNDGTLWCEHPIYVQAFYIFDRLKQLAPEHPEWRDKPHFRAAIDGDYLGALSLAGEKGVIELVMATHAGMTVDEFSRSVRDWLATARHPRFKRPFTELTYAPMVELLHYLRAHGFRTFIVTGGGIEFVRVWAEQAYGIPPAQVVGSSIKTRFELRAGQPALLRLPEVDFIDDGPGKPVGIFQSIGARPLAAFGNSDGDLQMLQYTTIDRVPSFGLIVHHTDAVREYAYDRDTQVGRLNAALDQAAQRGWTVVDMRTDWRRIFAFESLETKPAR